MKRSKKNVAEWGDDDAMLAEFAVAEGEDIEGWRIKEDRGLTGFGEGDVYRIKRGNREWLMVENTDVARAIALSVVKQDLSDEPEIFNRDFLENHIDMERLRRDLYADVQSERHDYYSNLRDKRFWEAAERYGLTTPEEDEDGELRSPTDSEIEEVADSDTEQLLKDPMSYLSDIYGDKEAVEQAIKIAGIDEDAAAEDAVDTDGWEHFLSHYDGNSYETAAGFVYWREN